MATWTHQEIIISANWLARWSEYWFRWARARADIIRPSAHQSKKVITCHRIWPSSTPTLLYKRCKLREKGPYGLFNSLWPSDTIQPHRFGSAFAQVMACCLTAPSHYLNQWWLIIKYVLWRQTESIFRSAHEINPWHVSGKYHISQGPMRPRHDDVIKWKHFPRNWPFVGEFTGPRWIPRTKASDAELLCFLWPVPELTIE